MSRELQALLIDELDRLLDPLVRAANYEFQRPRLFEILGWHLDLIPGLPVADLNQVLAGVGIAYDRLRQMAPPRSLVELQQTVQAIGAVFAAARLLSALFDRPGQSRPPQFDQIAREIVAFLTARSLFVYHPTAYAIGELLTIITQPPRATRPPVVDPASGSVIRSSPTYPMLAFDRFGDIVARPLALLTNEYMPAGGLADDATAISVANKLFPRLWVLFESLGLRAAYGAAPAGVDVSVDPAATSITTHALTVSVPADLDDPEATARGGVTITLSPRTRGDLGFVFTPFGQLTFTEVSGLWRTALAVTAAVQGFAIGPKGFTVRAAPGTTRVAAQLDVMAQPLVPGEPALVIGGTGGSRLDVGDLRFTAAATLAADTNAVTLMFEASKAAIAIAAEDGDGFLKQMLPADGLRVEFELGLGWSKAKGLYFGGAAGLEATLPVNLAILGVLDINSVHLVLRTTEAALSGAVTCTTTFHLGPLSAVVEQFGLMAVLSFPTEGGNLGVAHLDLRFKPPAGAALAINGPGVEGGGYLFFDPQKEQYAGIVQLSLADTIAVKGVGLLTTRMPDGSKGFSLLVIISAEGFSPIPLGFGFTLTGIGGLLGINRTAAVDTLRRALKTGALESVLFPADPVRDAPRVVSDAGAVFPPAPGRHVFGPMAKICWGTPTILTLNLGLVLETPEPVRLLVLGRAVAVLPEEKNALIAVRMDALGVIDFATGEIALDAVLFDSRIASFALTGEMALRASWGAKPSFLLAIGGFNPRFPAPPGFPALARLALALSGDDPNARLRMEAYLAITSNTVQFGARLDFYFAAPPFSLEGRLGFDTLFHFAPFSFVADLAAQLALRQDGALLTSVALTMSLSGPAPWHAWGTGQFVVAGVKQSFVFDARYGAGQEPALPAPVDVKVVDVSTPQWGVGPFPRAAAGAMIEIEGALSNPWVHARLWADDVRVPFQMALRVILDGSASVSAVGPPLYGQWYPRLESLPAAGTPPFWLSELNLEPRHRMAAGLGALVVRYRQEELMASAWEQLASQPLGNERRKRLQLAEALGQAFADRRAAPTAPAAPATELLRFAPVFTDPMYEPLRDFFADVLLPGLEHLPPNSVALLEPNRPFIEAYLVGLNHEMTRELLWRGFPVDPRATYFRQFWDVSGRVPPPTAQDRDQLADITPIAQWADTSHLGEHAPASATAAPMILAIRGELLRRYPRSSTPPRRSGPRPRRARPACSAPGRCIRSSESAARRTSRCWALPSRRTSCAVPMDRREAPGGSSFFRSSRAHHVSGSTSPRQAPSAPSRFGGATCPGRTLRPPPRPCGRSRTYR
jgi:hypothetical protein